MYSKGCCMRPGCIMDADSLTVYHHVGPTYSVSTVNITTINKVEAKGLWLATMSRAPCTRYVILDPCLSEQSITPKVISQFNPPSLFPSQETVSNTDAILFSKLVWTIFF